MQRFGDGSHRDLCPPAQTPIQEAKAAACDRYADCRSEGKAEPVRGGRGSVIRGAPASRRCRRCAVPGTGPASHVMKAPPARHWRSYSTEPLPTGAEALEEPFDAFPSWFLRIECDRCGK